MLLCEFTGKYKCEGERLSVIHITFWFILVKIRLKWVVKVNIGYGI